MIIDGSIYLDLEIVGKKTIKNFLTVNDLVDFQIIETFRKNQLTKISVYDMINFNMIRNCGGTTL